MQNLLLPLTLTDYEFLVGILDSNFRPAPQLRSCLQDFRERGDASTREELCSALEREIRYAGSSDAAYAMRLLRGTTPGVSFNAIIRDVGRVLKVPVLRYGTDREMLEELTRECVTQQFSKRSPEEQQHLLEDLGVDRARAAAFLKRSAGVFAVPIFLEAFGAVVVNGLIKTVILGTIARIIGQGVLQRLLPTVLARIPWWVGWITPVAWTVAIGWTAINLQGPARRKTVPIVLYLGMCSLRGEEESES